MSQGTLYAGDFGRSVLPRALIKHFNLDIAIEGTDSEAYKTNFPLKKVPCFIGPKGYKLTEVLAISVYFINLGDSSSKLLGKNAQEYAQVLKWFSLTNSEYASNLTVVFKTITGALPYNKRAIDDAAKGVNQVADIFNLRLLDYTFLVGERLTVADLFAASLFVGAFNFYGKEFRTAHPYLTRWFKTLIAHPILAAIVGEYKFVDAPVEIAPPKKEKKAAPKKEAAPKAAEEAEPAPAPKPKHPLEALGKPKQALDEWKRVYSNEETRETAIPWFWKNMYDPSEWSLWKVDYKYNDELTMTFMSNNLVGGFFNRLSASVKYMFGCMVVFGENNNNGITGFFLVRGQEHEPAFDVAPDWESYSFKKLDDTPETREFVDNMLAWDKPVVYNGENREIADGKVLK